MQALYQLQRGPMLGASRWHPDERALLHGLFLNAAPAVALRMLAPVLYLLDRASGQFTEVMPADIALWSGETCCEAAPNLLLPSAASTV